MFRVRTRSGSGLVQGLTVMPSRVLIVCSGSGLGVHDTWGGDMGHACSPDCVFRVRTRCGGRVRVRIRRSDCSELRFIFDSQEGFVQEGAGLGDVRWCNESRLELLFWLGLGLRLKIGLMLTDSI